MLLLLLLSAASCCCCWGADWPWNLETGKVLLLLLLRCRWGWWSWRGLLAVQAAVLCICRWLKTVSYVRVYDKGLLERAWSAQKKSSERRVANNRPRTCIVGCVGTRLSAASCWVVVYVWSQPQQTILCLL